MKQDAATADATIKNIIVERNNAATQLASSERKIERLNSQREMLLQDNAELKSEVTRLSQAHTTYDALKHENEGLRAEIARLSQVSNKYDASVPSKKTPKARSASLSHAITSSVGASSTEAHTEENLSTHYRPVTVKSSASNHQVQETTHEEPPVSTVLIQEAREQIYHQIDNTSESSHDITNLSYDGEAPFYQIRKTLEQERVARHRLRRNRRSLPEEDMTSGFILPDITIRQPIVEIQATTQQPISADLKSTDQELILDTPSVPNNKQEIDGHVEPTVTDHELDLTIYDEEPSERPSQPSAEALAAVMKSLREELADQKAQLDLYQSNYNKFDAAMNKRQRKRVLAKIQDILKAVDKKADQIYSLEDVIEGHRKDGQQITQEQVDNTLQSLGLDLPWEGIESTTASRRHSTSTSRSL